MNWPYGYCQKIKFGEEIKEGTIKMCHEMGKKFADVVKYLALSEKYIPLCPIITPNISLVAVLIPEKWLRPLFHIGATGVLNL